MTMISRSALFFLIILFIASCGDSKTDKTVTKTSVQVKPTESTTVQTPPANTKKKVLFFGDSLTAGFGLDEDDSFPSLVQNRMDSLGLAYQVINAGVSGETSADGKSRISWVLDNYAVDIFVLELGANDMLRGLNLDETIKNLRAIVDAYQEKNPEGEVIIAGMQAPPNMGASYTAQFSGIFKELATEYDAGLIPFLLDGVAGIPELNLEDGKHPSAEGQKIVLDNVWSVLKSYL